MTDLNHVALFTKVVETGSFSRAARALGIPRATVSRKVALLEEALGARLLHRTTRNLQLTALGQHYYDEASGALDRLRAAEQQVSATQEIPSGTLRVAAPVEFGVRRLMASIPAFQQIYPRVRLELLLDDGFVDLVAERIDIAFRTGRLASSSLVARKLGPARRLIVASPRYLRRRGTPKRIQDLHEHDCIVFGRSLESPVWVLDGPQGRVEVKVHGSISVNAIPAALQAAISEVGIALLPGPLVEPEIAKGSLERVLPRYGADGGGLYMVFPSNRHPSSALRVFIDFFEPRLRVR